LSFYKLASVLPLGDVPLTGGLFAHKVLLERLLSSLQPMLVPGVTAEQVCRHPAPVLAAHGPAPRPRSPTCLRRCHLPALQAASASLRVKLQRGSLHCGDLFQNAKSAKNAMQWAFYHTSALYISVEWPASMAACINLDMLRPSGVAKHASCEDPGVRGEHAPGTVPPPAHGPPAAEAFSLPHACSRCAVLCYSCPKSIWPLARVLCACRDGRVHRCHKGASAAAEGGQAAPHGVSTQRLQLAAVAVPATPMEIRASCLDGCVLVCAVWSGSWGAALPPRSPPSSGRGCRPRRWRA
jgi:hypothetical protein